MTILVGDNLLLTQFQPAASGALLQLPIAQAGWQNIQNLSTGGFSDQNGHPVLTEKEGTGEKVFILHRQGHIPSVLKECLARRQNDFAAAF